jgi:hypothetical protein
MGDAGALARRYPRALEPLRRAGVAGPEPRELWVGARAIRQRAVDPEWDNYLRRSERAHLREVRTIDGWCSPRLSPEFRAESLEDAWELLPPLPKPEPGRSYHLLYTDALAVATPLEHPRLTLLGHDLSDWTMTSSLFNCGLWTGPLQPIVDRALPNGLLTLEDAKLAQSLLPEAWNGDPHAYVTVWALYEVGAADGGRGQGSDPGS